MPMSYRPPGHEAVGPVLDGGMVRWNDAPGLGIEVDESVLGAPVAVFAG
jgi:cis-L-3-hydroxyproline dehydratase